MFNLLFSRLFDFIGKHSRIFLAAILFVVIYCAWSIPAVKFENDIATMLPADKNIIRQLQFLQSSSFSGKVVISLGLKDNTHTLDELLAAARDLEKNLHGPMVTKVASSIDGAALNSQLFKYAAHMPELITQDELRAHGDFSAAGIHEKVKAMHSQMMRPSSMFFSSLYAVDPFELSLPLLARLQRLTSLLNAATIENGAIVSADKRHVMVAIETPVRSTDSTGAKKLISFLQSQASRLPEFVEASIICAHRHAIMNEAAIKHDIVRISIAATTIFLLVLFVAYKDLRAGIFFLIPFMAVIVATKISALVFGSLPYFVVAMGAVIVGIADDYAIHIYTAVRCAGRKDIVKDVAWPLFIAVAVAVCVFLGFFTSSIAGYRQFAFFAIVSILLCFFFVLLIFPHFMRTDGTSFLKLTEVKPEKVSRGKDKNIVKIWLVLVILFSGMSLKARFDNDIKNFDAAGRQVEQDEKDFDNVWLNRTKPAIVVAHGKTLSEALAVAAGIDLKLKAAVSPQDIFSVTAVWPDLTTRRKNYEEWRRFWIEKKPEEIKRNFYKYGQQYGFKNTASAEFFKLIDSPSSPQDEDLVQFPVIYDRFVQASQEGYDILTYIPDTAGSLRAAENAARQYNDVLIVSGKSFSGRISRLLSKEVIKLVVVSFFMVLLVTFLLLRDFKMVFIALASMATALLAVAGGFTLLNKPLNAPALIAAMVVVGLAINYGVLMLYGLRSHHDEMTQKAMWVSSATTLAGAFVLLFALHPILYSIGLALSLGLTAGFLTAQFIVPALYRLAIMGYNDEHA